MKTILPKTPSIHLLVHRTAVLAACAALLTAPCLFAQTEAPKPAQPAEAQQSSTKLYSMKFSGGSLEVLGAELKAAFPKDNVVITPSATLTRLNLTDFEIRDAQLNELAKTIEFISDGKLIVEVAEASDRAAGNIWRIGNRLATTPATLFQVKMRSVAAPHLFSDKDKAERVRKDAETLETRRLERIIDSSRAAYNEIVGGARLEMLPEQKIFVIVGTEEGIAGMESFIKAAELLATDETMKKASQAVSLSPKMRAVYAPHLFNYDHLLDMAIKEFDNAQGLWDSSHAELMKAIGGDSHRGSVCVQQRPEQKLFVLIGSEEGIAGVESLIQAAEENAAEVHASEVKRHEAVEAEKAAAVRRETEAAEKAMKRE